MTATSLPPINHMNGGGLHPAGADVVVRLLSCAVRVGGLTPDVLASLSVIYPGTKDVVEAQSAYVEDRHGIYVAPSDGLDRRLVLGEIESHVDTTAFTRLAEYVMLHAGVVASDGAGILLPAASGAGKSTLVAALCFSGFRYLSDEFAVLCPDSLTLSPYAKSICLKPDGWNVVREAFSVSARSVDGRRVDGQPVHFITPPDPLPDAESVPVRFILMPERQPRGAACLQPITPTEALGSLLQNSLNLPWHGAHGIDALAMVAASAKCFRLTYTTLQDAVEVVSHLLPGTTSNPCVGGSVR